MSLVYITYHDENIFDVEKKIKVEVRQGHRYTSKFKKQVREQIAQPNVIELPDGKKLLTSSNKHKHKTLGQAETPIDPPCAFLRKNHGVRWQRLREHVCPPSGRHMPPVPRYVRPKTTVVDKATIAAKQRKEPMINPNCPHPRYFKGHKHRANFITANIERIKTSKAKRATPRYIDTPHGDRHDLLNTGLIPQYVCSKNFGKVPCYLRAQNNMLKQMRKRCRQEQQLQHDICMTTFVHQGVRQMTKEERHELLAGLKTNFAEVSKVYNSLSLYTDTQAKKLRKGHLEKCLRQLEQDIYLIESNPVILISEF